MANNPSESGGESIGLIAGNGLFPIYCARGIRARGHRVVAVALKGEAPEELAEEADEIHWTGLARLGEWIRIFKSAGVRRAVLCGGIDKTRMFEKGGLPGIPDLRTVKLWFGGIGSREDHTVLGAVADEMQKEGITIESSVLFCEDLLAGRGVLTGRKPTRGQWGDIRFAWPLAREVARLQIGQTIVVKDGAVVAVESIDGTDAALRRGGRLARGGAVAVKVAKPGHDPRFDIPSVGPETADVLSEAGIAVLAIHAGNTLVLGREELVARADKAGVCIVAVDERDLDEPGR